MPMKVTELRLTMRRSRQEKCILPKAVIGSKRIWRGLKKVIEHHRRSSLLVLRIARQTPTYRLIL